MVEHGNRNTCELVFDIRTSTESDLITHIPRVEVIRFRGTFYNTLLVERVWWWF
jgi:hypothetical protein